MMTESAAPEAASIEIPSITAVGELRGLDARPDTPDFRDRMYEPTLVEVPKEIPLDFFRQTGVPVLHQGKEGACTGFGLASVAHFLLRTRGGAPDDGEVSPRMLYEMAKRYDEWAGEKYSGSTARGAMKGWQRHGVCSQDKWPHDPDQRDDGLTAERAEDALLRPLGAYYRVNHKDLVSMHAALAEVGVLYATALVHKGWEHPSRGRIELRGHKLGGHAFAIVAYDGEGFWIQNSWGTEWGLEGFGFLGYADWLLHGTDVWVARLGAPVHLDSRRATAEIHSIPASDSVGYSFHDLRPHIISIQNDGRLRETGTFATPPTAVTSIFKEDIPRVTERWTKRRILLYAHGGLVSESSAAQQVANYRTALLKDAEVYPLAFIWRTDFWTTLENILQEAFRQRRPEGFLDEAKDFLLDRLDDTLEPLARAIGGKAQWDEMKENALAATTRPWGGARLVAGQLAELVRSDSSVEIHVIGHSAGSILHAPLVQLLTSQGKIQQGPMQGEDGYGIRVASCTLWAPASTIELFEDTYLPAIQNDGIDRFTIFNLSEEAEEEDSCARIYNKSLLYLVSNAFETAPRIPWIRDEGVPILGMSRFVQDPHNRVRQLFDSGRARFVLCPNNAQSEAGRSKAHRHGDFNDDQDTLKATLATVLDKQEVGMDFTIARSPQAAAGRRRELLGAQTMRTALWGM